MTDHIVHKRIAQIELKIMMWVPVIDNFTKIFHFPEGHAFISSQSWTLMSIIGSLTFLIVHVQPWLSLAIHKTIPLFGRPNYLFLSPSGANCTPRSL